MLQFALAIALVTAPAHASIPAWTAAFPAKWELRPISQPAQQTAPKSTFQLAALDLSQPARGHVLVFLSARCPCSASHEKKLRELAHEFTPQGFTFTAIHSNSDEPEAFAREHFAKLDLGFPIREDAGSKLADALGALKTPHAYIISSDGRLLYQGGVDDSTIADNSKSQFLRDALTDLKQGREPQLAQARSLGCIIKRPN